MDGSSIVDGSSGPGGGGDRGWSVTAAARFGVSAASATRWQRRAADHGTPKPQQQEGERRSARIEAHADLILGAYGATPDITLAELQGLLAKHDVQVALGTIWRFFKRRGITRKKRRRTRPSRTVPTS